MSPAQSGVLGALIMGHPVRAQPNTWSALQARGWVSDDRSITAAGLLAMGAPNVARTTPAAVVQNLTRYGTATAPMLARRMQTYLPLLERVLVECLASGLVAGPTDQYVAVGVVYPKTTWRFPKCSNF